MVSTPHEAPGHQTIGKQGSQDPFPAASDQQWPRVSIITPSYNQASYLETCIRSVLDQHYPNLEFLIVDGGSTDGSLAILRRYTEQLNWWVSEADAGQSDAINKGFRRATGEIVAWLNSDDFYLPGSLAAIAQAYSQNPQASFYFGDGLRVNESGVSISGFFPDGKVLFDQQALIFGLNYILQPAAFINRAILTQVGSSAQPSNAAQQVNYLNPHLQYGMDTDLWIRLASVAAPMPIPLCLAASREYQTTKTATGSFRRVEELRQIMETHANISMSPGVLCYFLDTLHRLTYEREDIFPHDFRQSVEQFWQATAKLLVRHGARNNGFPLDSSAVRGAGLRPQGAQAEKPVGQVDRIRLLQEQLAISEADRAARLAVIERLDAQVRLQQHQLSMLATERAAQLPLIQAQQTALGRLVIRLLRRFKLV